MSLRSVRVTCHTLRFNVAFCRVRQVRASKRSHTIHLKQLVNFAVSKVNQREWSAGGTWQVRIQLQSHAVEDRRQHITWLYGPISRNTPDWITCANRLATFHAATSKTDGKALRPVVAAASGIHFRRWSYIGATISRMPSMDVNGLEPWMSQVISSNTVRNELIVTKRTPASTSRRDNRQH